MKTNKQRHGMGVVKDIIFKDIYGLRAAPKDSFNFIIDIGAHIGVFSTLSRFLHPNSTIIAIEPCKETYSYLQENVDMLDIQIENIALGDGSPLFFYDVKQITGNAFVKENTGDYSIPSIQLKDLFQKHNIKETDKYFLKIDCEGGEAVLIDDEKSEKIFREATQIGMEIHFPCLKYKQFEKLPTYEQYTKWINKFKDTHYITYSHSRKSRGFGHYTLIHKTKAYWSSSGTFLPCSVAELIDRYLILEIKVEEAPNKETKKKYQNEKQTVLNMIQSNQVASKAIKNSLVIELKKTNKGIWDNEDIIRKQMKNNEDIRQTAPEIHRLNDKRSLLKEQINQIYNETFNEQKIYKINYENEQLYSK